jgi:predicted PurR-regulated permease PerM
MAEDRRKSSPDNPGLKVVPKRRSSDVPAGSGIILPDSERTKAPEKPVTAHIPPDAEAVAVVGENGEAVLLPLNPASTMAQKVIALAALGVICYFGKQILVPMVCALLVGVLVDPAVRLLERIKLPRSVGAFIVMFALTAGVWGLGYLSYVKISDFVKDLPQYSQKIKSTVGKVREQRQKLEKAKQAVAPEDGQDKNAVKVQTVSPGWDSASAVASSLSEAFLEFTFVLVLAYFGLTWSEHMRRSLVHMFKQEDRRAANRALARMSGMVRGFIVGNLIVGAVMAGAFVLVFWRLGTPNFLVIGVISGFVSLVPYLGVPLAMIPPLAVSLGSISVTKIIVIAVSAFLIHALSMNFIFPKVLGGRLKLNPLVVAASLLVWGFLWGVMGLILAVPITAGFKIVCDHVDTWRPMGELLGEG